MDALVSTGDVYITLPSNASMSDYPQNRLSSFRVKLNSPLQLQGCWEVALVELIFPTPLMNAPFSQSHGFTYSISGQGEHRVHIRPFAYKTINQLISYIKYFMTDKQKTVFDIEYDNENDRVKIYNRLKQDLAFNFPDRISLLMGFHPDVLYYTNAHNDTIWAPNAPDMSAGLTLMYVYTNICEPQVVGHKLAPLLRVVPCDYREFGTKCKEFTKPHYIPVHKQIITEIQIDIYTDVADERAPFRDNSRVIAKLHFRKRI